MSIESELNIEQITPEDNKTQIIDKVETNIQKIDDVLGIIKLSDISDDYSEARNTLLQSISAGREALDNLLQVANDSNSPRAYEVFATLLKNLSEVTEKLLSIHKLTSDTIQSVKSETKDSVVNAQQNNYFIGTSSELNRYVESVINNDKEVDVEYGSD
jgi:hypothetical protein